MERVTYAMTTGLVAAVLLALVAPNPAVAVDCGSNKSHNAYFGSHGYNDQLLFVDHAQKDGHLLRVVSTDVITGSLPAVITYIEALDQYTNGNGGCAFLQSGGPGSSNVQIHMKSQRGHGINFIVKIWGRRY